MLDKDLIIKFKEGDQRAYTRVFEEYSSRLIYFAHEFIDNRPEAEDIVVGIFTKLWKIHQNFDTIENIRAFLYIAVRNKCLDYLRSFQKQEVGKKEYIISLNIDNFPSKHVMLKAEVLELVYKEIKKLPQRCQQVFILTYLEGKNTNEIAQLMNISVSTVTTQRQRALKFLRKIKLDDSL